MTESTETNTDNQLTTASDLGVKIRACSAEVERLTADMREGLDSLMRQERINAWAAKAAEGADPTAAQSLLAIVSSGVAHRATFRTAVDLYIHSVTAEFTKLYESLGALEEPRDP
jgi:hypothetical protein